MNEWGGSKTIKVKVRVLAATNQDLEEQIELGNFRADLFYRLNVVPVFVPPLRQRLEDIPLLVADFLQECSRKGLSGKEFAPESLVVMQEYGWPGNVRELRNFIERSLIMSSETLISAESIRNLLNITSSSLAAPAQGSAVGLERFGEEFRHLNYRDAKQVFERKYLRMCLKDNRGNISQTAEQIGLERSHLHRKIKELAIA